MLCAEQEMHLISHTASACERHIALIDYVSSNANPIEVLEHIAVKK